MLKNVYGWQCIFQIYFTNFLLCVWIKGWSGDIPSWTQMACRLVCRLGGTKSTQVGIFPQIRVQLTPPSREGTMLVQLSRVVARLDCRCGEWRSRQCGEHRCGARCGLLCWRQRRRLQGTAAGAGCGALCGGGGEEQRRPQRSNRPGVQARSGCEAAM